jgi:hypothetical protein
LLPRGQTFLSFSHQHPKHTALRKHRDNAGLLRLPERGEDEGWIEEVDGGGAEDLQSQGMMERGACSSMVRAFGS